MRKRRLTKITGSNRSGNSNNSNNYSNNNNNIIIIISGSSEISVVAATRGSANGCGQADSAVVA